MTSSIVHKPELRTGIKGIVVDKNDEVVLARESNGVNHPIEVSTMYYKGNRPPIFETGSPIIFTEAIYQDGTVRYYLDWNYYRSNRNSGLEGTRNENRQYLQNNFSKHLYDSGYFNNVKTLVGGYNANVKLCINCGYDNFGNACGLGFSIKECPDQEASFRNSVRQLTGSALFAASLRFEWGEVRIDGEQKPVCKIQVTMDFTDPLLINGSSLFFRSGASTVELTNGDHISYLRDPKTYIAITNNSINK